MTIEDTWGGDIVTAAIAHLAQGTPPRRRAAAPWTCLQAAHGCALESGLRIVKLDLFFVAALASAQVGVNSRPRRVERSHDFDVEHYRIKLNFNEAARSFEGHTDIRLRFPPR